MHVSRPWRFALLPCLCGFLALGVFFASPLPPSSLAMQEESPTPPSAAASAFCPAPFENINESMIEPTAETVAAVAVPQIENPDPENADSAKLRVSFVTLPAGTCMLGSYFYPGVLIKGISGEVKVLIEHWPGVALAPDASLRLRDFAMSDDVDISTPVAVNDGDWLKIENESFLGFKNDSATSVEFMVAGLKPDGDIGGGGCGGGCRGRP